MAATNRPKRYTEKVLLTLEPEDLSRLNELADSLETTRTDAARRAIREEHRRHTQRTARKEPQEG
jgi:predicted transcriptional regulator